MMLEPILAARRRLLEASAHVWDRRQRRMAVVGRNARILPKGRIVNAGEPGRITIGEGSLIAGDVMVYPHAGRIDLGDYCYVGEEARIWSAAHVRIGHRVFLAHGVNVHDSDAHSLSAKERHRHFCDVVVHGRADFAESANAAEVIIDDDVWIGFNSSVLKGVHVGKGAIVGASSVVTRDVAAFTIVVGNPARVVGKSLP